MSWLNHLFLVYILFHLPWPYLRNIFLIIWNDIVMCPLPLPQSGGHIEMCRLPLPCGFMFWGVLRFHFPGKWLFIGFFFCFIRTFLLELRPAMASESGLLWFMWAFWRQAIIPGTFPGPDPWLRLDGSSPSAHPVSTSTCSRHWVNGVLSLPCEGIFVGWESCWRRFILICLLKSPGAFQRKEDTF